MRIARILFVAIAVIAALLIGARVSHAQTSGWLERSVDREMARLTPSRADSGGGFLIGFLPGDDAVFDDFDASFNGLVIGGVGALTGAVVGEVLTE